MESRISATEYHTDQRFDSLPRELLDEISRVHQIDSRPLGPHDVHRLIEGCFRDHLKTFEDAFKVFADQIKSLTHPQIAQVQEATVVADSPIREFEYGGRSHMVPEGYVFPKCATKLIFRSWHCGILTLGIRPLKYLRKEYRRDIDSKQRESVDKAAKVISEIESIARNLGFLQLHEEINSQNESSVFDRSYPVLLEKYYPDPTKLSRPDELLYTSIMTQMSKSSSVKRKPRENNDSINDDLEAI